MLTDFYALHSLIFIKTLWGGLYYFHVIEKIEKFSELSNLPTYCK